MNCSVCSRDCLPSGDNYYCDNGHHITIMIGFNEIIRVIGKFHAYIINIQKLPDEVHEYRQRFSVRIWEQSSYTRSLLQSYEVYTNDVLSELNPIIQSIVFM
jgi:hypothetical protein